MATKSKKMNLTVAVALYGDDALTIENALSFTDSASAAKWLADDYNMKLTGDEDADEEEYDGLLDFEEVHKDIKTLKVNDSMEWNSPDDWPSWIKWRVFRH